MIAPSISTAATGRLDAMPGRLRAALAGEIERLGRELRDRLRRKRRVSLVIDNTGETVTATIALRAAGVPAGKLRPRRPRSRFPPRRSFLDDMLPDIRARLEVAVQEAIQR